MTDWKKKETLTCARSWSGKYVKNISYLTIFYIQATLRKKT